MPSAARLAEKQVYIDKLISLLDSTKDVLIINVDNVGSKTLQKIRTVMRGKATVLMGKNTMIRSALRRYQPDYPHLNLDVLLGGINGNIGMVFVHDGDIDFVRDTFKEYVMPAAAVCGVVAPCDVKLSGGPTGLDPAQTSFFQALNLPTKIVKGSIEMTADVHLIHVGEKVTASQQALLAKLNMKPFEYGVKLVNVFQNGNLFDAAVLDISDSDLVGLFMAGASNVAAISREIGMPTEAALPHMIVNAFKNVAALVGDIDFEFEEVKTVKAFFKDPSAFAAAAAPAAGGGGGGGGAAPAAAAAAPVEEEEEEDMEFDLF